MEKLPNTENPNESTDQENPKSNIGDGQLNEARTEYAKAGPFELLSSADKLSVVEEYEEIGRKNPWATQQDREIYLKGLIYERYEKGVRGDDAEQEEVVEQNTKKEQLINLEEARDTFARSEVALAREGLRGRKIKDIERAEELAYIEAAYRDALKRERQSMAHGLEGTEDNKERVDEILLKTTTLEAVHLYDRKTEIMNEGRPEHFAETALRKTKAVEKWYRELRPRNKLLIAGALLATGSAGAVVGGVVGAGIVGTALAGKTLQRILAGAGVGVALEQAMKTAQSAHEKKALERAFGHDRAEGVMTAFEKGNNELDNALLRMESSQDRRKIRRYVLAATGGGLLASGTVASAIEYVGENEKVSGVISLIREKLGFGAGAVETQTEAGSPLLHETPRVEDVGVEHLHESPVPEAGDSPESFAETAPNNSTANAATEGFANQSGSVVEQESGLPPEEGLSELGEFFRQTPGYLTRTDALEEFVGMIERGDISAENFRLIEEGVADSAHELVPDRYDYEFDVLRRGEGVFGSAEVDRVRQEIGRVFDGVWGESTSEALPPASVVPEVAPEAAFENQGAELHVSEGVGVSAPDPGASSEYQSPGEAVVEVAPEVDEVPLEAPVELAESPKTRLDNLFAGANAEVHGQSEASGDGWGSQTIEGRINDMQKFDSAFSSFLDMIRSGELTVEDFSQYQSEMSGGSAELRVLANEGAFRLIQDPTSFEFSIREVGTAQQKLRALFEAMWLEKSR